MLLYGLIGLVLFIYALLDVLRTPTEAVRTLPKPVWLLAILPPIFGPIAWLLVGRPRREDLGGVRPIAAPPVPPDDDPEFLRELRRRADDQRRRARDPRDDAA